MTRTVMALVAVAGLSLPPTVNAQEDWEEPGLWVSAGGGFGSARTDCARCSVPRQNSFALLMGIGGSASKKVRFGIEGLAWIQPTTSDTAREYFGAIAIAQFFPFETLPVHLQGGIGGGRYAEEGGGDILQAVGFAIQLGAGYDLRFARGFDARLFLRYLFSNGLTTKLNRQTQFTETDLNIFYVGLALTWTNY